MCLQPILTAVAVVEALDCVLVLVFCEVHLSCANSENGFSEHPFYRWVQWVRGRGLDRQRCFPLPHPYLAQEGRLMAVGLHVFFLKDTDLDGYKCGGNLEELGCGVTMIRTYMKFSKNKFKKESKVCLSIFDPSSPKGSKHFRSIFFTVVHWTPEVQTVAQEVWVSWEGHTVRALLCPPLYCAVNLRVSVTSALQRF